MLFWRLRNSPFVQGARALGLPEWMVYCRYIFPSCRSYVITYDGRYDGAMLGGSAAVIENVVLHRGIGYMMVQGITARDYVLMQGYIIWITLVFHRDQHHHRCIEYIWLNPKRRAAIQGGSYE